MTWILANLKVIPFIQERDTTWGTLFATLALK